MEIRRKAQGSVCFPFFNVVLSQCDELSTSFTILAQKPVDFKANCNFLPAR